jgi:hypothetical protein
MKTINHIAWTLSLGLAVGICIPGCSSPKPATAPAASPAANAATKIETNAPDALRLAGTVVNAAGQPVAGATVEYWRYEGRPPVLNRLELKKQIATGTNGSFVFQGSRASGFLVARKPDMAAAWKQLGQPYNAPRGPEERLMLTAPGTLEGMVVDEADKPVADAAVFVAAAFSELSIESGGRTVNFLSGRPARDCFGARTDADGHFRIERFPTNAAAILTVQYPGKVLRQSVQSFTSMDSVGYRTGQKDIKLAVEPAGSIDGKIVAVETNQSSPKAWLTLRSNGPGFFGADDREPVQSGADGTFRLNNVAAGSYYLQAVFGTNDIPEWVAESVPVSVEIGQTTRDVTMTAIRGGLLEVTILGKGDRKPLSGVSVNAYKESSPSAATSGSNGVALLRLPPGNYRVLASRGNGFPEQASASVEADQTNRVEMELAGPKKITGVVHLPDGRAAAGLPVRLAGSSGPDTANAKTDANGRFELEWTQRRFGQNEAITCLLIRDVERNLAVVKEIDEDTGPLDLKLEPGLTLAGRAECDGKPLTNATGTLIFWTGQSGMHLTGLSRGTNTPGYFEIPALPPGRKYGILIAAPGYGQKSVYDINASADPIRQELDPVELLPANLKLAGQVLDADDKPVATVYVSLYGENQPGGNVRTDREGRFTFEHVCEGRAQLSANNQKSYGNVTAEGGDTNVVLHLGQTYGSSPDSTSHKLKGTVTDPDGKPVAGAQLAVFPGNGRNWTRTGTNGIFSLTWSLQQWQLQAGGPQLVVRDPTRNLAVASDLPEDATNLDVQLKPALTACGLVKGTDEAPLPGAQVGVLLKVGNSYDQLNEQYASADAQGRYEIKCLPADTQYIIYASAKGHGRSQQNIQSDPETNRLELAPFVLKLADRVVAGQVLNDKEKPASGVNVSLNGEDQPGGSTTTDSQGRFHFQVCEGKVSLYANAQNSYAQANVEAGDTNVVITLNSRSNDSSPTPRREALKGGPLPALATVNLAADVAPSNQPVLLCLFDAGQRPSRYAIRRLNEQAAALQQKNISVIGVQSPIIGDDAFDEWKTSSPVSFPIGRVTEKPEKCRWASSVTTLPWLILADANHKVIAEGFPLDDLDAQLKTLEK